MARLTLAVLAVCLGATTGFAQDPVKVNPKHYHVVVDNARVRVLHVTVAPGEKTVMHEHPDNVTILLTDGKMTFTGADGKSETLDTKAGTALASGKQKHMGANAGTTPLEAIVVELKGAAAPTAKLPATRPHMALDLLAENPRADVFKIQADAAFKEAAGTTHDYDQVVIAPGPTTLLLEVGGKSRTAWKRGDVAFIGRGQAHRSENTSGKPQEMIVVAIK
jgi:beta-alanine degradation protein BauB